MPDRDFADRRARQLFRPDYARRHRASLWRAPVRARMPTSVVFLKISRIGDALHDPDHKPGRPLFGRQGGLARRRFWVGSGHRANAGGLPASACMLDVAGISRRLQSVVLHAIHLDAAVGGRWRPIRGAQRSGSSEVKRPGRGWVGGRPRTGPTSPQTRPECRAATRGLSIAQLVSERRRSMGSVA
jgi:hypothetical protein